MSLTIRAAVSCLGFYLLIVSSLPAQAQTVCQGGGDSETGASCSALVKKQGYYLIQASAEATADKGTQGDLWLDLFVNDVKKGHAETVCEDGGQCRVDVVLQMLLKPGKGYKVEAKQGNNRADTGSTRITVASAAEPAR